MKIYREIGFFLLLFFSSELFAVSLTGTVFEKDSNASTILYHWKRTEAGGEEKLTARMVFTHPDRTEAVVEEVITEGGKIRKYVIQQNQTKEKGWLEIKDHKVSFGYVKEDREKTAEEDLPANLVVGPTLIDYLVKHWEDLQKGEKVKIRFAVLDRRETVGFDCFKFEEGKWKDHSTLVIKMKPSSIFIAPLVAPVFFTFHKETKKILKVEGRTLPKQNIGGRWQDLDAEIHYYY